MRRALFNIIGLVLVCSVACSHPSGSDNAPRTDMSVITKETLNERHFLNAYDAVESLRGNWLNRRGTDSFNTPTEVKVYLNDTMLGGVETLRQIGLSEVAYIRHYDGRQAAARWGLSHGAGVIYVSTRPAMASGPDKPPTAH